jgi:large subunit ribosomal protein L10
MNRKEKEQVIDYLRDAFGKSQASFLVNYKGLNVAQVSELRSKLREKSGTFKIAKVTLVKRVADELPAIEGIKPFLQEQVGLIFAAEESPAIAKILNDFALENKQMSILAGCMESSILSPESIKLLANLPSREVLLAQVAGTLKAPIGKLTNVLNMLILRLVLVLKEIEKKKAQS